MYDESQVGIYKVTRNSSRQS